GPGRTPEHRLRILVSARLQVGVPHGIERHLVGRTPLHEPLEEPDPTRPPGRILCEETTEAEERRRLGVVTRQRRFVLPPAAIGMPRVFERGAPAAEHPRLGSRIEHGSMLEYPRGLARPPAAPEPDRQPLEHA